MFVSKYYCNVCKKRFLSEYYLLKHYWKCRNIAKSKTINNLGCNVSIGLIENSDHIKPIKSICASTDVRMNSDKTVNESEVSGLVIKSGNNYKCYENLSKHMNSKGEKHFENCLANKPESPILHHPRSILNEQEEISYSEAKQISNLKLKESYVKLKRINLSKYLNISPKKRELKRLQILGTLGPKMVAYGAVENCMKRSKTRNKEYFSYYKYNSEDDVYFQQCKAINDNYNENENWSTTLETDYQNPLKNSNLEESSSPIGFVNQKILRVMFIGLMNLENEVGTCISESFSFLPDFVEGKDDGQLRQSLSFGIMKSRVLDASYDYLHQFQEDLYAVLDRAQNSSFNSSISKDSVRLKEEYIKIRNKLWGEKRPDQLLKNNFLNETVRHVIVNNSSKMDFSMKVIKPQQRPYLKETSKPTNDLELLNIENAQPLKSTCVIKDIAEDCNKIMAARIPKAIRKWLSIESLPFPHLKSATTMTVVKKFPSESSRQTKSISVDCLDSNQSIASAKLNICNYSMPENQQVDFTASSSPYIVQSPEIDKELTLITSDTHRQSRVISSEDVKSNHSITSGKFDMQDYSNKEKEHLNIITPSSYFAQSPEINEDLTCNTSDTHTRASDISPECDVSNHSIASAKFNMRNCSEQENEHHDLTTTSSSNIIIKEKNRMIRELHERLQCPQQRDCKIARWIADRNRSLTRNIFVLFQFNKVLRHKGYKVKDYLVNDTLKKMFLTPYRTGKFSSCPKCALTSINFSSVCEHIVRKHLKLRPYVCRHFNCFSSFTRNAELRRHYLSDHGYYNCTSCHYICRKKRSLASHLIFHKRKWGKV